MINKETIAMIKNLLCSSEVWYIDDELYVALDQMIHSVEQNTKYRKEMRRFKNKYITLNEKYQKLKKQLNNEEDDKK